MAVRIQLLQVGKRQVALKNFEAVATATMARPSSFRADPTSASSSREPVSTSVNRSPCTPAPDLRLCTRAGTCSWEISRAASVRRRSSAGAPRTSMNSRKMMRTLTSAMRIAATVTAALGTGDPPWSAVRSIQR